MIMFSCSSFDWENNLLAFFLSRLSYSLINKKAKDGRFEMYLNALMKIANSIMINWYPSNFNYFFIHLDFIVGSSNKHT